jgi:hypothetical protein
MGMDGRRESYPQLLNYLCLREIVCVLEPWNIPTWRNNFDDSPVVQRCLSVHFPVHCWPQHRSPGTAELSACRLVASDCLSEVSLVALADLLVMKRDRIRLDSGCCWLCCELLVESTHPNRR